MAFHDVRFPEEISYGSRGGPGFRTSIVELDSLSRRKNARTAQPLGTWDVSYGVKSWTDLSDLKRFFIARQGALHSFRFKDWLDFRTPNDGMDVSRGGAAITDTDQVFGTGDGSKTQWQLVKKYSSGPATFSRSITKPVSGTVVVAIDGTPQASGWSVDYTTGKITFTTAPLAGEQLTWGGEFDVHAEFGRDADRALHASLTSFDSGSIDAIEIVEVVDPGQLADEHSYGGGLKTAMTGDVSLSMTSPKVQVLDVNGASRNLFLPPVTATTPDGGPIFWIMNDAASGFTLTVKDSESNTVVALTPGDSKPIMLYRNRSAGTYEWFAF